MFGRSFQSMPKARNVAPAVRGDADDAGEGFQHKRREHHEQRAGRAEILPGIREFGCEAK